MLRQADYREHDKVLSLLTPGRGRVEALCRGCRRPKSPLLAASQPFTLGEYVLYKGRGHEMITACQVKDSYYPLREDWGKLSYGAIMLAAADIAAQPELPQEHLMILLTRSLHRLCYTELDPKAVTTAYLLHFISLQGYRPRLNHCVKCGREVGDQEAVWLDAMAGGIVCQSCKKELGAMRLPPGTLPWLRGVLIDGIEKTPDIGSEAPIQPLKRYVEHLLERKLPSLPGMGAWI